MIFSTLETIMVSSEILKLRFDIDIHLKASSTCDKKRDIVVRAIPLILKIEKSIFDISKPYKRYAKIAKNMSV